MSIKILAVDMSDLPDATKELVVEIATAHEAERVAKDIDKILGINQVRDPAPLVAFFEPRWREPSVN